MTPLLRIPHQALEVAKSHGTSLTTTAFLGFVGLVALRADQGAWAPKAYSKRYLSKEVFDLSPGGCFNLLPAFDQLWTRDTLPLNGTGPATTHIHLKRPTRFVPVPQLAIAHMWATSPRELRLEHIGLVVQLYAYADRSCVRVGRDAYDLDLLVSQVPTLRFYLSAAEISLERLEEVLSTLQDLGLLVGSHLRSAVKLSSPPTEFADESESDLKVVQEMASCWWEMPDELRELDQQINDYRYGEADKAGSSDWPVHDQSMTSSCPIDPTADLRPETAPSFAPMRGEKKKSQAAGYPRVLLFLRGARGRLNLVSWAAAQVASRVEDRQLFLGSPSREDLLEIADRLQQTQDHRPLPDRSTYPLSFFEEALELLVGQRVLGTEDRLRLRSSLRSQRDPGELAELLEASLPLHEAYRQRLEALEEGRRAEEALEEQVSTPLGELVHLLRQSDSDLEPLAEALQAGPEREVADAHLVEHLGRAWAAWPADYRKYSGLRTVGEYLGFLSPKAGALWRETFGAEPPAAPLPEVDLGPEVVEVVAKLEALRAELAVLTDPLPGLTPEQAPERWLAGEVRQVDLEMQRQVRAGHLEELDRLQAELSGGGPEEELGRLVEKARWFLKDRREELEELRALETAPVAPIRVHESSENGREARGLDRPALSPPSSVDLSPAPSDRGTLARGAHESPPLVPSLPPSSSPPASLSLGDLVRFATLPPASWAPSPPLEGGAGDRLGLPRTGGLPLPRTGGLSRTGERPPIARVRPFRAVAAVAASPPGVRSRAAERSLSLGSLPSVEPPSPPPGRATSRDPALPVVVHARALGVVRGPPLGALGPPL